MAKKFSNPEKPFRRIYNSDGKVVLKTDNLLEAWEFVRCENGPLSVKPNTWGELEIALIYIDYCIDFGSEDD